MSLGKKKDLTFLMDEGLWSPQQLLYSLSCIISPRCKRAQEKIIYTYMLYGVAAGVWWVDFCQDKIKCGEAGAFYIQKRSAGKFRAKHLTNRFYRESFILRDWPLCFIAPFLCFCIGQNLYDLFLFIFQCFYLEHLIGMKFDLLNFYFWMITVMLQLRSFLRTINVIEE